MSRILTATRNWLEARYLEAGLAAPGFRWVRREDARAASPEPAGILVVEDRELHLLLLLVELDGGAVEAQVHEDLRVAQALGSACLPGTDRGIPGAAGAWRVALHWLGAGPQGPAWRRALLQERQRGGALETLPVNATFLEEGEPLEPALEREGFPGLLLATRGVFRRSARETLLWSSADQRVRSALAGLPQTFPQPRARAVAEELLALCGGGGDPAPAESAPPATQLEALTIQDVRGIRHLALEPTRGGRAAQAWVLTGPNGSGKSSLAEAVSLKAFGSSRGLCAFLADGDVSKARTSETYLAQYVAPLDGGTPLCGFRGQPAPFRLAPDLPSALAALAEAEGTVAPQGGPRDFLGMAGDALGARMAQSLSGLALRLEAHLEAGRARAGEGRTSLARRHGLSSNTRLPATFQERILRTRLQEVLKPLPAELAEFLACRAALPGGMPEEPPAADLDAITAKVLRVLPGGQAMVEATLAPFLEEQEARLDALREQVAAFRAQVAALPAASPGLAAACARWAEWLEARPAEAPAPAEPAAPGGELPRLLAERATLAEEGMRAKPHQAHLEAALAFIRAHWADRYPQACPTCGSSLEASVEATVASLLTAAEQELAASRAAYAALTARIRSLESQAPPAEARGCPLPLERRRQLETTASLLLGPGPGLEIRLLEAAFRTAWLRFLRFVEAPPALPEAAPAATAALAATLLADCRGVEEALAEPEAWDLVAKEVTRRLSAVVAEHLPSTLEALWRELAANLSPAPWLLPSAPRLRARTLRGANRVDVVLGPPGQEPRLARHLLNDAQRDTLGLAWTFCQHLLRGRFRHAWMLLDDPAQDMDAHAFRALCRFLATLLNLQEAAGLPFTLILLLNQEERALEAARETGQGLLVLGWTGKQEDGTLRRIELFGEGTRCPQPGDVFVDSAS